MDDSTRRIKRLRKRVSRWGRTVAEPIVADGRGVMLMVTLTYRPGEDPKPGDRKEFMRKVRRRLGDALLGYTNVAETTKKGVVHYHYLMVVRRGVWLPTPDKVGLWVHGSTNVLRNLRTAGYLLKYVSKSEAGEFTLPRGMRAYDVRARIAACLTPAQLIEFRLSAVPRWLEEIVSEWCIETDRLPERIQGGGWRLSGTDYQSPWQYISGKPEGLRSSLIRLGKKGRATATASRPANA